LHFGGQRLATSRKDVVQRVIHGLGSSIATGRGLSRSICRENIKEIVCSRLGLDYLCLGGRPSWCTSKVKDVIHNVVRTCCSSRVCVFIVTNKVKCLLLIRVFAIGICGCRSSSRHSRNR